MNLLETLHQFPALANVPDEQLQWVIDRAEEVSYPEETVFYKPNEPVEYLMLLLEGRIRIDGGGASDEILTYDPYSVLGVLPFSRMKTIPNRLVSTTPTRLLRLHRDKLHDLIHNCYELTEALVHQMTTRVRDYTKLTQQTDKMASWAGCRRGWLTN